MKIITALLLSVALFPILATGQIEVSATPKNTVIGKVKQGSLFIAELSYLPPDKDTIFLILYNNFEYQTITELTDNIIQRRR